MKVVAKERGFYGVQREQGDVFDFDPMDAKRDVKRDKDGRALRDPETGAAIADPEGQRLLPTWMAPANDENVEEYQRLPADHPTLDEENRPYPYSIPYAPQGTVAPMDEVAKAVNDVVVEHYDAEAERRAEVEKAFQADADKRKTIEMRERDAAERNFARSSQEAKNEVAAREAKAQEQAAGERPQDLRKDDLG